MITEIVLGILSFTVIVNIMVAIILVKHHGHWIVLSFHVGTRWEEIMY